MPNENGSKHSRRVSYSSESRRTICPPAVPVGLLPPHARGAGLETWTASEIKLFKIPDKRLQCIARLNVRETMRMSDVKNYLKWAAINASVFLLYACAYPMLPGSTAVNSPGNSQSDAGSSPVPDGVFKDKQVIAPHQSIEQDNLQVSYNMKDKSVSIRPRVTLLNDKGHQVEAYTKTGFLKFSARVRGSATANVTNPLIKTPAAANQSPAQERTDWANSYWLKERFGISAQGIEIGGLAYHCSDLNLPMKLIVKSGKQEFVFIIKDPLPVLGEQQGSAAH
jgi:hypothetical protein